MVAGLIKRCAAALNNVTSFGALAMQTLDRLRFSIN
jgi:hypothetical protein